MKTYRIAHRARLFFGAFMLALASSAAVHATPVTSAYAITTEDLSITVGDKTFSNFTCSIADEGNSSFPTVCDSINVLPLSGDPYGIRFQSGFVAAGESFLDVLIGFDVTVNDPSQSISDIYLGFNGAFLGMAVTNVTETAYSGLTQVGQAAVFNAPWGSIMTDTVELDGLYKNLRIEKDILLAAWDGVASISFIDQRFHQVPEPGSLALAAIGLMALTAVRRRKSA